jgi:hypothetical protein
MSRTEAMGHQSRSRPGWVAWALLLVVALFMVSTGIARRRPSASPAALAACRILSERRSAPLPSQGIAADPVAGLRSIPSRPYRPPTPWPERRAEMGELAPAGQRGIEPPAVLEEEWSVANPPPNAAVYAPRRGLTSCWKRA